MNGTAQDITKLSLIQLDLDERSVVVELNRKIIRRTEMESLFLKKGDNIELVHFVGGG